MGPTRQNAGKTRFPLDDPGDVLVINAHWSIELELVEIVTHGAKEDLQ